MNKHLFFAGSVLASSILVACGGGSSSDSTSTTSTNVTYTGSRATATLSQSNQTTFVSALLVSAFDVALLADEAGARASKTEVPTTVLRLEPFYAQLRQSVDQQIQQAQNTAARTIQASQNCASGGTLSVSGTLDNTTNLGTLQFTFSQCNTGDALVNGSGAVTLNAYDTTYDMITDMTFVANNLVETVVSSGKSFTLGGSFRYLYDATTGVEQGISNLARKSSTGKQTLDSNLAFVADSLSAAVSGGLCEGDNGCVTVATPETYQMSSGVITQGSVVMTGASGSKVKLYSTSGVLWMDLDANGDGTYETTTRYVP